MSEVWLNDIDSGIYAFWFNVVNRPDELCELILKAKLDIKNWEKQRAVFSDPKSSSLELAYATLYLNRTNRSGILKGGVIGGRDQCGAYQMDCRFNNNDLVEKIQRIHLYKDVIQVSRLDAKECLVKCAKYLPNKALINVDPPYFNKGRGLYLNYYISKDHETLARLIKKIKVPWMLTMTTLQKLLVYIKTCPFFVKVLTTSLKQREKPMSY